MFSSHKTCTLDKASLIPPCCDVNLQLAMYQDCLAPSQEHREVSNRGTVPLPITSQPLGEALCSSAITGGEAQRISATVNVYR